MKSKKMESKITQNRIFKNRYLLYVLIALAGFVFGGLIFHSPKNKPVAQNIASEEKKEIIWTCAKHPQIRMPKPGKCPICGMDLIPLNQESTHEDPDAIHLTMEAVALANVMTTVISGQNPVKEVRLYGKVQTDERLTQSQVAFISGRIEKLYVNFTGETVKKGQPLALIYSPDMITAQQELLEAVKARQLQPEIYEAAREKLHQWKLTDDQIESIEKSGKTTDNFEVVATTTGIITSLLVSNGQYVSQGTALFQVADLSKVWVMFDAYETDLPFVHKGDKITFFANAIPGRNFSGTISFIDPVIDPVTRVARVRVEMPNTGDVFKPEMFVTGIVTAKISSVKSKLVVPRSAVLWTGKRSVVYVKQPDVDEPVFKMRVIELGPSLGDSYVVESGLNEGEEVVTNGAFSVDAAAQLEGKPSMMNLPESKSGNVNDNMQQTEAKMVTLQHDIFPVSGNCEMCKDRIENAARSVRGVTEATWNIETKQLDVKYDNMVTNTDDIKKAIAAVGHDTDKFKAPDDVYNKLPECCLYRK